MPEKKENFTYHALEVVPYPVTCLTKEATYKLDRLQQATSYYMVKVT